MFNQMTPTPSASLPQLSDVVLDIDNDQLKISIHGQEYSFESAQQMDDFLTEFWQRSIR